MRILVVTSKYQPEYSGSGLRAHKTYVRLNQKYKLQFDVVTSSINYSGLTTYFYDNIEVTRIAGQFNVSSFNGLLRRIVVWINFPFEIYRSFRYIKGKLNKYDMLHTFGDSWAVGFFTWYFSRFNKPVVRELCNEIESPYFPLPFKKLFKKLFTKDNMMMVAISPKLESLATQNSVKNIWQRPNPVDENQFNLKIRANKFILRNQITPFSADDVVLTYVATFWRNKNQLFLIKLLAKLDKKFKLVLAGPVTPVHRSYYKKVIDEINNQHLNDRVFIVSDFVNNPHEYIALSDVYLFPSRHEGLGTPILEAQACGVPVVMNEMPGISDKWISIGRAGYVCALDTDTWVRRIEDATLIEHSKLYENSKYISSVAGSDVVDKEYFLRCKKIFRKSSNEQ